jgi:hypothetical protein
MTSAYSAISPLTMRSGLRAASLLLAAAAVRDPPYLRRWRVQVDHQLEHARSGRSARGACPDVPDYDAPAQGAGWVPRMLSRIGHGASGVIYRFAGWDARGPAGHQMLERAD